MYNNPMGNEKRLEGYLPPNEQLILAAKVNRLCAATPDTFDLENQIQDAQDIVTALDPRMKYHGRFSGRISMTSHSESEETAGETNAGSFSTGFEQETTKKVVFGVEEYRVGNYVATKYKGKGEDSRIVFEHSKDRGMINEIFEKDVEDTRINYSTESLDVQKIFIAVPTTRKIACIRFVSHEEVSLWERSKEDVSDGPSKK